MPHWSASELAEFHHWFNKMRSTPEDARRIQLAFEVIRRDAPRVLEHACRDPRNRRGCSKAWQADVFHDALLMLVRRISSRALRFEDRGERCLASWYQVVCRTVARRAWERFDRPQGRPLESLDETQIPVVSPPARDEVSVEDVLWQIRKMPPAMQTVMSQMAAGIPGTQTAEDCDLSPADVSKLRKKGLDRLRRLFQAQLTMSQ